jgi:hypothetical protein
LIDESHNPQRYEDDAQKYVCSHLFPLLSTNGSPRGGFPTVELMMVELSGAGPCARPQEA